MKKIQPKPGQESVWDYPRPPALESCAGKEIVVKIRGQVLVQTTAAFRVLETSHPPTYYLPFEDTELEWLKESPHRSWCEWKGEAAYFSIVDPKSSEVIAENAIWYYPKPTQRFAQLRRTLAIYPSRVESCEVAGKLVESQEGDFYGGWITPDIVGPFKGAPGTYGW